MAHHYGGYISYSYISPDDTRISGSLSEGQNEDEEVLIMGDDEQDKKANEKTNDKLLNVEI